MADEKVLTEDQKKALEALGGKISNEPAGKSEDEIAAEKKLAEETAALEAKKKKDEADAAALIEAEKNKKNIEPVKVEMSDDELMQEVAKRSGRVVKSWDELKPTATEADKKKAEEVRDADKLSFGLKKGLFNKTLYEGFISDSKSPVDLIRSRELATAKAEDGDWNADKEKEFNEEFEEKFGLDGDPTSQKYKRGQRQLNLMAETILKKDYAPIYELDSKYAAYEGQRNAQQTQQQKILSEAPAYTEAATKIISTFNKIDVEFDGEKFEVPVSAEMSKALTDVMLDNNFSADQIVKGYKKEDLNEFARQYLIGQNFQALAFEAAKKYRDKHEKGLHGIPEGGKLQKKEDGDETLTDNQKKALNILRGVVEPIAN